MRRRRNKADPPAPCGCSEWSAWARSVWDCANYVAFFGGFFFQLSRQERLSQFEAVSSKVPCIVHKSECCLTNFQTCLTNLYHCLLRIVSNTCNASLVACLVCILEGRALTQWQLKLCTIVSHSLELSTTMIQNSSKPWFKSVVCLNCMSKYLASRSTNTNSTRREQRDTLLMLCFCSMILPVLWLFKLS